MTGDMAERFARDTAKHQMTVLHDDGLYRHLRFANPDRSWNYWFDLITAPGVLLFQGDGDSFVFRRLEDMFAFFRGSAWQGQPNIGYWAEKLGNGERSVRVYQQELLQQIVDDEAAKVVAADPKKFANLATEVREYVTDELLDEQAYDLKLVDDFRFWADPSDRYSLGRKQPDFQFHDTFEWTVQDYHWWFLWACHAILWGIAQYDAASVATSDTTEGTT